MKSIIKKNLLYSVIVILLLTLTITTCNSGGAGGGVSTPSPSPSSSPKPSPSSSPNPSNPPASYNGVTWTNADLGSGDQKTAKSNGYDFEFWNEGKAGTASMTLGSGGAFTCSYNNIKNVLFRAGRKFNETQTHSKIGTISIEFTADKFEQPGASGTRNAYLSVYGWMTNGVAGSSTDLVEYYIVENFGEYDPGTNGSAVLMGDKVIDGATYKFYRIPMSGRPSIRKQSDNFTQYMSVRQTKRMSGTIDVSAHFNAWAAITTNGGMPLASTGKMYEVAFKVESYGGDDGKAQGSAEISKNILSINGTPIK
jgi:endo-1,4-beta-xylanase